MTGFVRAVLLLCVAVGAFADPDACETVQKQPGRCVLIRDCPPLLELLRHQLTFGGHFDHLKAALCGFEGKDSKVCCSLNDYSGTDASSRASFNSGGKPPQRDSAGINLLPAAPRNCGFFTQDRILPGNVSQLNGYPWTALLEYQKPSGTGVHCGGVLINDRYVLTAAHCITGPKIPNNWNLIGVRLGEFNVDTERDCESLVPGFEYCAEPLVNVGVEEVVVHELYEANSVNQRHDIALLRLSHNVNLTLDFIWPICLKRNMEGDSSRQGVKEFIEAVGWGITETRSESSKKERTEMTIWNSTQCKAVYGDRHLEESQLCASAIEGHNHCLVDSGGVLMDVARKYENYYATGVMSFGHSPCGQNEFPIVFTKVKEYLPWITSKLKP